MAGVNSQIGKIGAPPTPENAKMNVLGSPWSAGGDTFGCPNENASAPTAVTAAIADGSS